MTRHLEDPNAPRPSNVRRPPQAADLETDVSTIVTRLQDYYLSQGDEVQIANGIYLAQTSGALDYVASQNADGSWSDVDYTDRTSSANGKTWDAYKALYRMVAIAQAIKHNQGKLDPAGANGAWRTSDYLNKALATRNAEQIKAGFATMVQT